MRISDWSSDVCSSDLTIDCTLDDLLPHNGGDGRFGEHVRREQRRKGGILDDRKGAFDNFGANAMTRDALRFQEPAISGGSSVGRRHRRQPFIQGMQPFAAFRSGTRGKRGRRIGNAVLFLSRWSKRTRGTRLGRGGLPEPRGEFSQGSKGG